MLSATVRRGTTTGIPTEPDAHLPQRWPATSHVAMMSRRQWRSRRHMSPEPSQLAFRSVAASVRRITCGSCEATCRPRTRRPACDPAHQAVDLVISRIWRPARLPHRGPAAVLDRPGALNRGRPEAREPRLPWRHKTIPLVGGPAATGDGVVDSVVLPSSISSLSVLPHSWAA